MRESEGVLPYEEWLSSECGHRIITWLCIWISSLNIKRRNLKKNGIILMNQGGIKRWQKHLTLRTRSGKLSKSPLRMMLIALSLENVL